MGFHLVVKRLCSPFFVKKLVRTWLPCFSFFSLSFFSFLFWEPDFIFCICDMLPHLHPDKSGVCGEIAVKSRISVPGTKRSRQRPGLGKAFSSDVLVMLWGRWEPSEVYVGGTMPNPAVKSVVWTELFCAFWKGCLELFTFLEYNM